MAKLGEIFNEAIDVVVPNLYPEFTVQAVVDGVNLLLDDGTKKLTENYAKTRLLELVRNNVLATKVQKGRDVFTRAPSPTSGLHRESSPEAVCKWLCQYINDGRSMLSRTELEHLQAQAVMVTKLTARVNELTVANTTLRRQKDAKDEAWKTDYKRRFKALTNKYQTLKNKVAALIE